MAHSVDLEQMSLSELVSLATRIERRIRYLNTVATSKTLNDPRGYTTPVSASTNSMNNAPTSVPVEDPAVRTTLSERVQGLIQTNDPWEGSGVEPTRWFQLFYGGHVIRAPEVFAASLMVHSVHDPLPVFGGLSCTDISGSVSKPSGGHSSPSSPSTPHDRKAVPCPEVCVICYSPCTLAGRPHRLHACERHRLQ